MHGRGRMAPGRRAASPWVALAARMGGHLVQFRAVKRTASRPTSGPDAGQGPGSSGAVRCGSLGGSGRADGRASGPGSGQSAGRPDGPPAGRAEGHGAGAGPWPDSSRAVRCGSLGGSGRGDGLAPGHHGSRRSRGRPGGPPAGRTLTRCRAAPARRCTPPGAALAERMDGHLVPAPDSQEAGQTAHQRAGLRATGWNAGQWPGGSGRADGRTPGPVPGGQENSQQTHERAGCLAEAGQLQGGALRLPGWLCGYLCVQLGHNQRPAQCFKSAHVCGFWALLAEQVGGTWSRLRAVRRTARQATGGPQSGRWAGAGRL